MQEDCKSRELQANDKEDRTQEDCNTQARCRLRVLPVVQLVVLPPVLPVVPLPAPVSRYSEPSGDGPAGRRLPPSLRPAAVARPGLSMA